MFRSWIRSLAVGFALMVSCLTFISTIVSADLLPNPSRRNLEREQPRCNCFHPPCDCDRVIESIRDRSPGESTYANCGGGDFRPAHLGAKPVCTYSNFFCDTYSEDPKLYSRGKIVTAVCFQKNGSCPSEATDECVNTKEIKESDMNKIVLDPARTGDNTCNDSQSQSKPQPNRPAGAKR